MDQGDADEEPVDAGYAQLANLSRVTTDQATLLEDDGYLVAKLGPSPYGPPPTPPAYGQNLQATGSASPLELLHDFLSGKLPPESIKQVGDLIVNSCKINAPQPPRGAPAENAYAAQLLADGVKLYEGLIYISGLQMGEEVDTEERAEYFHQAYAFLGRLVAAQVRFGAPKIGVHFSHFATDKRVVTSLSANELDAPEFPTRIIRMVNRWRHSAQLYLTEVRAFQAAHRSSYAPPATSPALASIWPIGWAMGGRLNDTFVSPEVSAEVIARVTQKLMDECLPMDDAGREHSPRVFAATPWIQGDTVAVGSTPAVVAFARLDDMLSRREAFPADRVDRASLNTLFSRSFEGTISTDMTVQIAIVNMLAGLGLDPESRSTTLLPDQRTTTTAHVLRSWKANSRGPLSSANIISLAGDLLVLDDVGKRPVLQPALNKELDKGYGRRK